LLPAYLPGFILHHFLLNSCADAAWVSTCWFLSSLPPLGCFMVHTYGIAACLPVVPPCRISPAAGFTSWWVPACHLLLGTGFCALHSATTCCSAAGMRSTASFFLLVPTFAPACTVPGWVPPPALQIRRYLWVPTAVLSSGSMRLGFCCTLTTSSPTKLSWVLLQHKNAASAAACLHCRVTAMNLLYNYTCLWLPGFLHCCLLLSLPAVLGQYRLLHRSGCAYLFLLVASAKPYSAASPAPRLTAAAILYGLDCLRTPALFYTSARRLPRLLLRRVEPFYCASLPAAAPWGLHCRAFAAWVSCRLPFTGLLVRRGPAIRVPTPAACLPLQRRRRAALPGGTRYLRRCAHSPPQGVYRCQAFYACRAHGCAYSVLYHAACLLLPALQPACHTATCALPGSAMPAWDIYRHHTAACRFTRACLPACLPAAACHLPAASQFWDHCLAVSAAAMPHCVRSLAGLYGLHTNLTRHPPSSRRLPAPCTAPPALRTACLPTCAHVLPASRGFAWDAAAPLFCCSYLFLYRSAALTCCTAALGWMHTCTMPHCIIFCCLLSFCYCLPLPLGGFLGAWRVHLPACRLLILRSCLPGPPHRVPRFRLPPAPAPALPPACHCRTPHLATTATPGSLTAVTCCSAMPALLLLFTA